ncbi:RsmB/NOP family class I SAM-dependent RNA methyltransferase [Fodinicurvata fenggangensis]|uniref:RsmB/NOP family class I SAM-dependent RNA methyltransferase n=1 Tax=Fodinicurvata fenggangensis TaxID=1121830 RepID=UPI00047E1476|nr:RsmB/NOP family class I SAM-dependent RNA methyltransferase [Fodinicurvata fenggangensis]
MTPAARMQAAIELYESMSGTQRPSDRVAADYFRQRRYIGAKDRRNITLQCYGALRGHARINWWIARWGGTATPRRQILAWHLLANGESLDSLLACLGSGKYAPHASDAEERALLQALATHTLDHPDQPPSVALEMPEWLMDPLQRALGDRLEVELAALRQAAAVDLRVNSLKADVDRVKQALHDEGIETEVCPWSPLGLRIDGRRPVAATKAFRDGLLEVQDEGSQLVALLADARPGQRICDFCAGAGGKTLALAAAMENKGQLLACDVLEKRLARSSVRLRRAGVHNVTRRALSSERDPWLKRQKKSFDRVLVDAPCSGSGTWRRNPEGKWRLSPEDLNALLELQGRILDSAARLVKPGGRLIYATCSLLREENEERVDSFLKDHGDFVLRPVKELWPDLLGTELPEGVEDHLRLFPAAHGTDGFFAAVLERQEVSDD